MSSDFFMVFLDNLDVTAEHYYMDFTVSRTRNNLRGYSEIERLKIEEKN